MESLSRRTNVVSLFMELRKRTDSVTVTLSQVLNLRQQSEARKLFKTLVTIHVNINNRRNDTAFLVADKQNPSLCLLSTQPWYRMRRLKTFKVLQKRQHNKVSEVDKSHQLSDLFPLVTFCQVLSYMSVLRSIKYKCFLK